MPIYEKKLLKNVPNGMASLDSNTEVIQQPTGAELQLISAKHKSSKRADGTWLESFGDGQTWQDFTIDRNSGVTYINSTGKPIMVSIRFHNIVTAGGFGLYGSIDGVSNQDAITAGASLATGNTSNTLKMVVPDGSTYKVVQLSCAILEWWELG